MAVFLSVDGIIMDRLEAMMILLRVVDKGSFSAASRDLGVPLASVSRKVIDLETHLGARLLVRTTRTLALTEAGRAFVAASRRILDEVDEAERVAAGEYEAPRGELVLTAPILFGRIHLLPVVTAFLAAYPDITIRLSLSDRNLHLLDESLDMAVRIGPLPDSGMIATSIGSMRTVVCASPQLLGSHGAPSRPEDLASLPCVGFEHLSGASIWTFRGPAGRGTIDVAVNPRLTVTTAAAAVWAAAEGVGATRVLHYQCADAVRSGALRLLLADYEPAPLPIHLIHAARGVLPLKMRFFLDFAAARLRHRLAALS
jgi:DNA-binding transcriptional LysR family regulator